MEQGRKVEARLYTTELELRAMGNTKLRKYRHYPGKVAL